MDVSEQIVVHTVAPLQEIPMHIIGERAGLIRRVFDNPFFKSEASQPLFGSVLGGKAKRYLSTQVVDTFPLHDFLGVRKDEEIIMRKNLNPAEEMPIYGYLSPDLANSVMIQYRRDGGYDIYLTESKHGFGGESSERETEIFFDADHKVKSIIDVKRSAHRDAAEQWITQGARSQYQRKGDAVEMKIKDIINTKSRLWPNYKWQKSDTIPDFLHLKPDTSLAGLPISMFAKLPK